MTEYEKKVMAVLKQAYVWEGTTLFKAKTIVSKLGIANTEDTNDAILELMQAGYVFVKEEGITLTDQGIAYCEQTDQ